MADVDGCSRLQLVKGEHRFARPRHTFVTRLLGRARVAGLVCGSAVGAVKHQSGRYVRASEQQTSVRGSALRMSFSEVEEGGRPGTQLGQKQTDRAGEDLRSDRLKTKVSAWSVGSLRRSRQLFDVLSADAERK